MWQVKLGVVFPQGEIEAHPVVIRDFAQTVEGLGFDYLMVYDLVIDTRSDEPPAAWQEPFTLLSYLAGVTEQLELATGVVVLPSRQAVLVAKQAAALDLLSGGRLRLGVSVGWNQIEYQAMGTDFEDRGARIEEQIKLMRRLWTESFVSFSGEYHTLEEVGIYPRPADRTVPIWMGGYADVVLRRVATLGDGWMAHGLTPDTAGERLERLYNYVEEAGRKRDEVGLNIVGVELNEPQEWGTLIGRWRDLGATHLDVVTREAGLKTPEAHLNAIRRFKEAVDSDRA
jgi:probable F420-dependent oxidoreductase